MSRFTFDHIHLRSPGPERTAAYYEKMFDAEIRRTTQAGQPRVDMVIGGRNVFIAKVNDGDGVAGPPVSPYQGLDHFGLAVTDIDAIAAELRAKGAEFTIEPYDIRPGVRIAFVRGPEGVSIELLQRTPL